MPLKLWLDNCSTNLYVHINSIYYKELGEYIDERLNRQTIDISSCDLFDEDELTYAGEFTPSFEWMNK